MRPATQKNSDRHASRRVARVLAGLNALAWVFAAANAQTAESIDTTQSRAATAEIQRPISREEQLWREVRGVDRALTEIEPDRTSSRAALNLRRQMLQKIRAYLRLYPGGAYRDEAVRLELKILFEIGALTKGLFDPLKTQIEQYLRTRPSDAAVEEAAFWKIHCEWIERVNAAGQPTSQPIARVSPELYAAARAYIETYPRSRHLPRMAAELFLAAEGHGDVLEQRRLVELLERKCPQHLVTKTLAAQLRLNESLGEPFSIAFRDVNGEEIDTAAWTGVPVLIVVWGGFSEACRTTMREIESYRVARPELRVAGVNLDDGAERMAAVCRELGLSWPQYHDGLGWSTEPVRNWGVRRIPLIFAVDRAGRLAAVCDEEDWHRIAEKLYSTP